MSFRSRRQPAHLSFLCALLVSASSMGQEPRSVIITSNNTGRDELACTQCKAPAAPRAKKRCWADYSGHAIRCSDFDGTHVELIAQDPGGPYGISLDPNTGALVWTSAIDEAVKTAPAHKFARVTNLNTSFDDTFAVTTSEGEHAIIYALIDDQVLRVSINRHTGVERREVLLQVRTPGEIHGLALTADHTALYLGDSVGRMSRKLIFSTHQVIPLAFASDPPPPATTPVKASPVSAHNSHPQTSLTEPHR